jgi:hypothetical protein
VATQLPARPHGLRDAAHGHEDGERECEEPAYRVLPRRDNSFMDISLSR